MATSTYGYGSRWQAQRGAAKRAKIGRFAEALSTSGNITQAARSVGISQQTGSLYFREICRTIDDAQRRAGFGEWAI